MATQTDQKRLFFGLKVEAPWPEKYPKGRVIQPIHRHLTLAFLGTASLLRVRDHLTKLPPPPTQLGLAGAFSQCLFLPKKQPRVVAWEAEIFDDGEVLTRYQQEFVDSLLHAHFPVHHSDRPFLSHVTVARGKFSPSAWQKAFQPLPLWISGLHLYESLGNSEYRVEWSHLFDAPFEEFEHTADKAFHIRGANYAQLARHAQLALCFDYPPMTRFLSPPQATSLDELIIELNHLICEVDQELGCPFKAVSFHGEAKEEQGRLNWEMIVDV